MVLAPFDTIKTVQQFSRTDPAVVPLSLAGAARSLVNRGGIGELYSGVAVTVLGSMPSVGLYFGVYQWCKLKGFSNMKRWGVDGERWRVGNVAVAAAVGNTVAR